MRVLLEGFHQGVWGLGFRVQGLGFRVWGLGCILDAGCLSVSSRDGLLGMLSAGDPLYRGSGMCLEGFIIPKP